MTHVLVPTAVDTPPPQSVLVKQLERELASTVSALKDERRERRGQTETLRRKLEEARGTVGDREAELQRYAYRGNGCRSACLF